MPSLTVENYLKTILQISMKTGQESVSPGQIALTLTVAPGTVTSMLKTLAESELAEYKPYEGVKLTKSGWSLAMRMLRRHRLIEQFLVNTLQLTWDQVHGEAENMEHAVSDFLIDRIDEFLGHPASDPHGDPIPNAEGEMRGAIVPTVALTDCVVGTAFRLVRVTNQKAEFLRFLSDSGIEIGIEGTVLENNSISGIMTMQLTTGSGGLTDSVGLSCVAADVLLVEQLVS